MDPSPSGVGGARTARVVFLNWGYRQLRKRIIQGSAKAELSVPATGAGSWRAFIGTVATHRQRTVWGDRASRFAIRLAVDPRLKVLADARINRFFDGIEMPARSRSKRPS